MSSQCQVIVRPGCQEDPGFFIESVTDAWAQHTHCYRRFDCLGSPHSHYGTVQLTAEIRVTRLRRQTMGVDEARSAPSPPSRRSRWAVGIDTTAIDSHACAPWTHTG